MKNLEMKKNEEDECAWKKSLATHNNDLKRPALARRPPMPKYQSFFPGLCYACNTYGHKATNCKAYARNGNIWRKNNYENSRY